MGKRERENPRPRQLDIFWAYHPNRENKNVVLEGTAEHVTHLM